MLAILIATVLWAAPAAAEPLVFIDPGHGGAHAGAKSVCGTGVDEKDVTLGIARTLAALLEASQQTRVALSRTTDVHVPLEQRAAKANAAGADLLLSIHANASRRARTRGVETFFVDTGAAVSLAHRHRKLVHRENRGLEPGGRGPDSGVQRVLDSLRRTSVHAESQRFALRLQSRLKEHTLDAARGVLQAPFIVLRRARMPSALVEVGFMTNPAECRLLAKKAYQKKLARALAAAVFTHLAAERTHMAHAAAAPRGSVGRRGQRPDREP